MELQRIESFEMDRDDFVDGRILGCIEDLQRCVSMQILYSRYHKGSHHLRQLLVRYGTYEHTKLGGGGVAEKADVSCVL
jgi:hypothetical protein